MRMYFLGKYIGPFTAAADLGGIVFSVDSAQFEMEVGAAIANKTWRQTDNVTLANFFRNQSFDVVCTRIHIHIPVVPVHLLTPFNCYAARQYGYAHSSVN